MSNTKEENKDPQVKSQKTYGLTDLEKRMIQVMMNRHQEEYANYLTYVCLSRLSVTVGPNTQLKIENEQLVVTEVEPEAPKDVEKPAEDAAGTADEVSVK